MTEVAKFAGWHVARVTLQALSPLSCASGQGQDSDVALVRDANGLPMIPGATLQGLLRSFCPGKDRDTLFGREVGDKTKPAKLIFSNGLAHDSHDTTVGFCANLADSLLSRLMEEAPIKREHVRLDHRHGAEAGGKFDRAAVPKGTRFSFEVLARDGDVTPTDLAAALTGLSHPLLRMGGSGRKGYGKVQVVACTWRSFGVDEAEEFRKFRATPLSNVADMKQLDTSAVADMLTITLPLSPVQPWRTGQGPASHGWWTNRQDNRFPSADKRAKPVDLVPLREPEICWKKGKGEWKEPSPADKEHYVLPASSVRGPLLHRTLYHWNRLNQQWAGAGVNIEQMLQDARKNLNPLFGFVSDDGETGGQASPLFIDDVPLQIAEVVATDHIRIDRFTGGVVQGALYSQELVQTDRLDVTISIDMPRLGEIGTALRDAFLAALCDLAEGRLALGAKSLGFCTLAEADSPGFAGVGEDAWKAAWDEVPQQFLSAEAV